MTIFWTEANDRNWRYWDISDVVLGAVGAAIQGPAEP